VECELHWPLKLWIYDLRTNLHFTLKENTLKRSDLDDFVACYNPKNRHERKESERFKSFTYEELIKRDTHSLPDSNVPGFPRHTQNLGASRRRAGLPASANLDILTPSFPTQSASRPSRLMLRSQQIQVWLKDAVTRVKERPGFPSLEDSANLLGIIQAARLP